MTAPERRAADLDLDAVEERWLVSCPSCDGGLAMNCACPPEDHRIVIGDLVAAVRAERQSREQAEAERDALRRELLAETYRPEGGEIVMRELIRAKAERDSARAELARLREAVETALYLIDMPPMFVSLDRIRAALSDAGQPQTGDSE